MNRLILRITLKPTFHLFPYVWTNHYAYSIRKEHRTEKAFGHRLVFLCFDCEFSRLPKNAHWNPDGTHFTQPAD